MREPTRVSLETVASLPMEADLPRSHWLHYMVLVLVFFDIICIVEYHTTTRAVKLIIVHMAGWCVPLYSIGCKVLLAFITHFVCHPYFVTLFVMLSQLVYITTDLFAEITFLFNMFCFYMIF